MKQTENYVQDAVLLALLTIAAAFTSHAFYISMLICGTLMLLLTVSSLEDAPCRTHTVICHILCGIFAAVSGGLFPCLIFYICRTKKVFQITLPAAFYLAVHTAAKSASLPEILLGVLILLAAALAISLAEQLMLGYLTAAEQTGKTVSVTAVNEMYEKKLNRELVVKNYLADKNARLEERETISRNIHNSVGHSITAAVMTLDAADMLFDTDPDRAREKMNTANERIRESLGAIRHAVRVLSPDITLVSADDLISELTDVIDSFVTDTMIKASADLSDIDPELLIPHEHTEFLTGAVQELLTNGVRHGKANSFTVSLAADSSHIKLSVSDNGGSDFSEKNAYERIRNGFGLKKLISYAEGCGGSAVFENNGGFNAVITLSLYKE